MVRWFVPCALSIFAACAPVIRPVRLAVWPRATPRTTPRTTPPTSQPHPEATAAAPHEELWPEPAPRDPVEVSFEQSVLIRLAELSRELHTTLSMQSHTPVIRASFERDLYVSDVRVRHDDSGRERVVRIFATRPAVLRFRWRFRDMAGDALRDAASALMFERWLQAQPGLRLLATFRTSGAAWLRWRSTDAVAVVCAHETPAHGPVFEGCWTERAPLATLDAAALQYEYGRHEQLRVRYQRQGGGPVNVRIDASGVHGARAITAPDWGPLANLRVTVLSYTPPERVEVTDAVETFECVRETQWRCGGYRSAR